MVLGRGIASLTSTVLIAASCLVVAHGHDDEGAPDMEMGMQTASLTYMLNASTTPVTPLPALSSPETYFMYPDYQGLMFTHILLMTVAWFFMLPIGRY